RIGLCRTCAASGCRRSSTSLTFVISWFADKPTPTMASSRQAPNSPHVGTPWERLRNGLGTPALYGVWVFMGQPTTTAVADMSVGNPHPSARARGTARVHHAREGLARIGRLELQTTSEKGEEGSSS